MDWHSLLAWLAGDTLRRSAVGVLFVCIVLLLVGALVLELANVALARWRAWRNPIAALRAEDSAIANHKAVYCPVAGDRAERLLQRLFPSTNDRFTYVEGGATGHLYRISRWSLFYRIYNLSTGEALCAVPFNRWSLPRAANALAQALYLACSETERAFLALANRQRFLLTYSRD